MVMQTASQCGIDILLLSEPNRKEETVEWYQDNTGRAAIVINNPEIKVSKYASTNQGYVWVEIGQQRIYSCYFSPNDTLGKFTEELNTLEDSISTQVDVLITGDFNGKSPAWGETRLDRRGILINEMIARKDLIVINTGNKPTFNRGEAKSVLDITIGNQTIANHIVEWEVLDEETLSDHNYITFKMVQDKKTCEKHINKKKKGWNARKLNRDKFKRSLEEARLTQELVGETGPTSLEIVAKKARELIEHACNISMPKKSNKERREPKYWWTEEIAELRKKCVQARRQWTRSRGNYLLQMEYKGKRKELNRKIRKGKRKRWKTLIQAVQDDPWGQPLKKTL